MFLNNNPIINGESVEVFGCLEANLCWPKAQVAKTQAADSEKNFDQSQMTVIRICWDFFSVIWLFVYSFYVWQHGLGCC